MFDVNDILAATAGRLTSGAGKKIFTGVSVDSRTIRKGELFVAVKGRHFDGHDFICEAVKKGACGIVLGKERRGSTGRLSNLTSEEQRRTPVIKVEDTLKALGDIAAYHRRRFHIPAIGITGSNGKTSVKEMSSFILGGRYSVLKNMGTENNLIGLPLTLLKLNKSYSVCVLEMGASRFGEIKRLTDILKPTVGLITNIGRSHTEFLKDREGVLKAKSELSDGLVKNSMIFINGDDTMLSSINTKCRKLTFGFKRHNDFHASKIKSNGGISFVLNDAYLFSMNIIGRHNVYNALAAIAVSGQFGISMAEARHALSRFKAPHMRMELKDVNGITVINDAYNSNPLSLKWAVHTLSNIKNKGRKIMISGDMLELGEKSRVFHNSAGRLIASSPIDTLITVGRLSRYTWAAAGRQGMKRRNLWACSDADEAADILRRVVKQGDVVLIKGSRAMGMEKIVSLISKPGRLHEATGSGRTFHKRK